ncbi:ATP-binding protein [Lachnospiraceae bacterium ZAX-1]
MATRKNELNYLEQAYKQEGNQLLVLYGRKNIGIEELVKTFCQDKKFFYFHARQVSETEQRTMFGKEIEANYNISILDYTYETFFNRIRSGNASKLVLVIDEFQRMVKNDPGFMSAILKLKSRKLYPGPVFILFCSSSIAWVEQDMVQTLGTAAKKLNDVYKVKELKFVDMVQSFQEYTVSECVRTYGIIGGIPGYMKRWDSMKDVRSNICRHILSEEGFLYEEAQRFIKDELRELTVYNTILTAIASGKRKLNDLFQYTGYSRAKISVYLKNLMEFEVVEKVYSLETGGWENTQKGLYQIKNTYINFWFKFIFPHLSDLHMQKPEEFYTRYIEKELEDYLNRYFRQVCVEYLELRSLVNRLPIKIHKTATWIGKQGSIDIVAQNSVRENIVALCNWSEDRMAYEMYEKLLKSMGKAKIKANYYYFFSAKAFDEKLIELSKTDDKIVLIDMNRM